MRIAYILSNYISHKESGKLFIDCLLSLGHDVLVVDDALSLLKDSGQWSERLRSAEVAIIHDDPLNYPLLFEACQCLRDKYVIAYAVWETPDLPAAYCAGLSLCREIWTCSQFSAAAMRKHFSNVSVLPHVVKRFAPKKEDILWAREAVKFKEGTFLFFSIVDACNPRKNVETLLGAFSAVRCSLSSPVGLVLKQYRMEIDYSSLPGVVSLYDTLTPGQMAALHVVTQAYVSAHHCEAWGLGMSEAMAYGKPVIATGYSGNREFMDASNSFPVPYSLVNVPARMAELIPLFTTGMQWADIDVNGLEATMRNVALGRYDSSVTANAPAIVKRFGKDAIAAAMNALLRHHPA